MSGTYARYISWIRKATVCLIFLTFALIIGCKSGSETLWSAESKSPDGQRLASARTIAQSGFGTGYIGTAVYLNWTAGSQPPVQILNLSYEHEVPQGITDVEMKWLSPTRLEVTYKGNPSVVFQAVKCGGVDILLRGMTDGLTQSIQ